MRIKVYVRSDDPQKNRIGVYKIYERTLRENAEGYYVKIRNRKVYVYYEEGTDYAFIRYWS